VVVGRRGFEEQFHWIFVLIAGGVILGFFFVVAQKQRSLSTERLQLTLVTDVEDIFVGALVSKGAAQVLPLPPQGIGFECTRGCECRFRVSNAAKSFGGKSFFAPRVVRGDDALVWTVDWKQPFRVSNFVMVTNPSRAFVFVYDENNGESRRLHEQVVKGLPPPVLRQGRVVGEVQYVNATLGNVSRMSPLEFDEVRFVFLGLSPERVKQVSLTRGWEGVSGVSVDANAVGFYEYAGRFDSVDYISYAGLPTVFAAIFAEDSTMYACSVGFAFGRLAYLSEVYARRAQSLSLALEESRPWCSYQSMIDQLRAMGAAARAVADAGEMRGVAQRIAEVGRLGSNVERLNNELVLRSCPELF